MPFSIERAAIFSRSGVDSLFVRYVDSHETTPVAFTFVTVFGVKIYVLSVRLGRVPQNVRLKCVGIYCGEVLENFYSVFVRFILSDSALSLLMVPR